MWRGLMLTKAVEQFLRDVHWGELDDLLIDMPPGTGDVQMGLARLLPRADMVIVTTPALAAQKVAQRAADMARRSFVRVVGVIENMTDFTCDHGDRRTRCSAPAAAPRWPTRSACRCSVRCRSSRPSRPAATPAARSRSTARRRCGRRAFPAIAARLDEVRPGRARPRRRRHGRLLGPPARPSVARRRRRSRASLSAAPIDAIARAVRRSRGRRAGRCRRSGRRRRGAAWAGCAAAGRAASAAASAVGDGDVADEARRLAIVGGIISSSPRLGLGDGVGRADPHAVDESRRRRGRPPGRPARRRGRTGCRSGAAPRRPASPSGRRSGSPTRSSTRSSRRHSSLHRQLAAVDGLAVGVGDHRRRAVAARGPAARRPPRSTRARRPPRRRGRRGRCRGAADAVASSRPSQYGSRSAAPSTSSTRPPGNTYMSAAKAARAVAAQHEHLDARRRRRRGRARRWRRGGPGRRQGWLPTECVTNGRR